MKTVREGELYDFVCRISYSPAYESCGYPLDEPIDHPIVGGESSFAGDVRGMECYNRFENRRATSSWRK